MTVQRELLTRHVESLRGRLNTLDNLTDAKLAANGGNSDGLSLKLDKVNEEVPHPADDVDDS